MLEIWDYTFKTWDAGQADDYLSDLAKFFDQLVDRAVLWRKVEGRKFRGVYCARFRQHYVFFHELGDGAIGILTILHQAMDIPGRLGEDLKRESF